MVRVQPDLQMILITSAAVTGVGLFWAELTRKCVKTIYSLYRNQSLPVEEDVQEKEKDVQEEKEEEEKEEEEEEEDLEYVQELSIKLGDRKMRLIVKDVQ